MPPDSTADVVAAVVAQSDGELRRVLDDVLPLLASLDDHDGAIRELRNAAANLVRWLGARLEDERTLVPLFLATRASRPRTDRVGVTLGKMRREHRTIAALLDRLRDLSHDYAVPDGASDDRRHLVESLGEIDRATRALVDFRGPCRSAEAAQPSGSRLLRLELHHVGQHSRSRAAGCR